MSHASQPAGMFAQLLGASAARRRGGPPADDGPGGGPAPGEFDVEQLLSLFVERAIQAQGLGGGGGGKHFSLRLPSDEQLATAQDLLPEDVSMGVGSGAPAGGPQPASRAAVEALPTVEIGAAHAEKSCAICCEPFVPEIKGLPPFCPSLSLPPTLSRLSVPSPCLPPATSRLSCPCVCSVGAAVHAHLLRDVHPPVAAQEQFMPRLQARARNRDRSEPQTNAALESQNAAGGHSLAEPVVWMIVLQQRSRRRRGLLRERRKHPAFHPNSIRDFS